MELTAKQLEGLNIAVRNYNVGLPYTVISGYAGAGKSTLIKFIIDALDIDEEYIAYVAYTGKAANVLREKGCPNPTTAHKLLYWARPMPNGTFHFEPRKTLERPYKLIVVDEVSMLPKDMWQLLLSHHIYVIAAGDPGQLPPIDKEQTNNVLDHPDVFLDEIMRQAQESAIIRLSMHIREGKDFRTFPTCSGEVRIIPHARDWYQNSEDYQSALMGADEILCATNKQRIALNQLVRALQHRGTEPEVGDKVIGLTNHWMFPSRQGIALTNGAIGTLKEFIPYKQTYPTRLNLPASDLLISKIGIDEDDEFIDVPIDYQCLTTGEMSLNPRQIYQLNRYVNNYKGNAEPPLVPFDFAYAYAITTWKAQGSEWDYVLGFDGAWLKHKDADEYIKYLYTLVTRASKSIILVGD